MVSLLQPLVNIAIAEAGDQCDRMVNFKTELRSLERIVLLIEIARPEAEEKQADDLRIHVWLRELDDIYHDARDILDEFVTVDASIRAKWASKRVKSNSLHSISLRVSHRFSTVFRLGFRFRFRLANKIKKLRKRLDRMKKDMENAQLLDFVGGAGCSPNARKKNRPKAGPYPDKHLFVGRDVDKEKIMEKLLNPKENHVEVVPIWGMGGVGKTTLARSVYNDKSLTEELYPKKNRRWLCVGEKEFNAEDIIHKITKESNTNDDVEDYQEKLKDKFIGDRFLIVLDDVWVVRSDEWKLFWNPLNKIREGGLIIITTRKREVITAIDTPVPRDLRPLSYEDCWKIFESRAFNDGHTCSDLEQKKGIGKQIVEKLKGLPLAADVVGRSLSSQPDVQTWRSFLEDDEWKLSTGDDNVMLALRWSYNLLLPHLKQCFTYCSLFPKDHIFDKKMLVEMWMAHGYIRSDEKAGKKIRPEDIGALYFEELVNASLFQCVHRKYKMHDMIHALATLVSKENFLRTDGLRLDVGQLEKVRHISIHPTYFCKNLSLCMSERSTLKRLLTLYTLPIERYCYKPKEQTTYLCKNVIQDIFKQLKSIRVLVLVSDKINYIPECIRDLIHLRYLDIQKTNVSRIPDTLCDLHNLQTLVAPIGRDSVVTVLPKDIVNMVNLRHLRACLLTCKGLKNLTSLQELYSINVSEGDKISELEGMELREDLRIKCLENVTNQEDAAQAMMHKKTYIDHLELEFTKGLGDTDVQTKVLDALQCPPNLRVLEIRGYNGLTSPSWMVDGKLITHLQSLCLSYCHRLELLPPLGQLNGLKKLTFYEMDEIKKLGEEFYGKQINQKVFFPSLKTLEFGFMGNLEKWDDIVIEDTSVMFFPGLKTLYISTCSNLVSALPLVKICTPHMDIKYPSRNAANVMRSLSKLEICYCDKLVVLELDILVSLKHLEIRYCSNLTHIKSVVLNSLRSLTVMKCPMLILFEDAPTSSSSSALRLSRLRTDSRYVIMKMFEHNLVSLRQMYIQMFPNDELVKNNWHKLTLLETLQIFWCDDLESLPPDIHNLSSLRILWLQRCPKLQALPADGLPLSLEVLVIAECPLLYERCQESGADWNKIKHIPKRKILQLYQMIEI